MVSMYDIVVWSSVRVGGNRIDDAIINYVRKKYNLLIGEQTAEEIKIKIGSALPLAEDLKLEVRGRDQVAGLPRTIEISSEEVTEGIAEPLAAIVGTVKQTLEKTPPELAADIIDRGMVLTGGGSLLRNIDDLLTRETGVPCYVAENPMACTAIGAGKALRITPSCGEACLNNAIRVVMTNHAAIAVCGEYTRRRFFVFQKLKRSSPTARSCQSARQKYNRPERP